jgi:peptidase E
MCFALFLSLSASMMSIEKATCHVLAYCEETGNILSAPLPTKWKFPIPVDEILDFPIPATASHLEALEEHVDTDFVVADDIAQAISEPVHNGIVTFNNNDHDETKVDDILSAVSQIKIVASGNERGMRLKPIVDKVVELSGTDLPKVLYVGTASFDRTDKFLQQTQAFRDMGCEIRRLDVSEKDTVPTLEEMREVVTEWADVIMGSGGNTLHALLRWKEVGLDLLMKEASLKGVVLCGGSAGAGCWFSSLHTDSLRPDNTKNKEHVLNELSEEVSSFLFVAFCLSFKASDVVSAKTHASLFGLLVVSSLYYQRSWQTGIMQKYPPSGLSMLCVSLILMPRARME